MSGERRAPDERMNTKPLVVALDSVTRSALKAIRDCTYDEVRVLFAKELAANLLARRLRWFSMTRR